MCRASADLKVVAIELLKSSLQSLCTGAVAPTGVRHEHHHPLPPLGGCLPLACVVVSAHGAQCTLQRQSWCSERLLEVWSARVSVKRRFTSSKGKRPEERGVCWAPAANLFIIASCVGNQQSAPLWAEIDCKTGNNGGKMLTNIIRRPTSQLCACDAP